MQNVVNCPSCDFADLEDLPPQVFKRAGERSEYHQSRIDFLLDEWFGGDDEVTITWKLCKNCGFICYSPRPSEEDLAHKYDVLSVGKAQGGSPAPARPYDEAQWRQRDPKGVHALRAADLHRTLAPLCSDKLRILDYGGGGGQLLEPFLLEGHECEVCDYGVRRPMSGVAYAGPTADSIAEGKRYDLIICSHVFEHLGAPRATAATLLGKLAENGLLYIEVPCAIFRQPPRPSEPVTHVNFFSTKPLNVMLEMAGGNVLGCHYAPYRTTAGGYGLAVKSLTERGGQGGETAGGPACHEATKLLLAGRVQPLLSDWLPGAFDRVGRRADRARSTTAARPRQGPAAAPRDDEEAAEGGNAAALPRSPEPAFGPSYWAGRQHNLYYRAVHQYVQVVGRDARSVLDVGGGPTPIISWYDWIPRKIVIDPTVAAGTVDGVDYIKADFLEWPSADEVFDVVTCLQVLEHVDRPKEFAEKLKSVARNLVISVPYKWSGADPEHVNDPVDEGKLRQWFELASNYSQVFVEPFGPPRLVQYYDLVNGPSRRFDQEFVRRAIIGGG